MQTARLSHKPNYSTESNWASKGKSPSVVSLPPSKATSSARAVEVSEQVKDVASCVIRESPLVMVESSNNPTITEQAPLLQPTS
jgi:hypothetical protein